MQLQFAREEGQASGRKCRHLLRELIRCDLNEAVWNAHDDGLLRANNVARDSTECSLGLGDGEHFHESRSMHDLK